MPRARASDPPVTTEQAEAPGNYVDFEDKQEGLKGTHRARPTIDNHAPAELGQNSATHLSATSLL